MTSILKSGTWSGMYVIGIVLGLLMAIGGIAMMVVASRYVTTSSSYSTPSTNISVIYPPENSGHALVDLKDSVRSTIGTTVMIIGTAMTFAGSVCVVVAAIKWH